MANDIGFRVGVEGEKDFKNAIADINRSCRVLGSEMQAVASQFDKGERSVESLTARNEVLNKQIDEQKGKIETLKAALQNASESFGETDKRTQNWQIQLNNAEAALNGLERELRDNKRDMEAAENATDEETKALKDMGNEADNSSGKFKAFGNVMKAAVAAVAAIGAASVAAGKKIYDLAASTAAAGDEIDKNSQKVGLSYDSYQKWDYTMKIAGTSMSNCTTGLKTLTNTFDDAINGSDSAITKFQRLGLSLYDLKDKSREEVFAAVVEALQNVSDETEKAALANDMFGKSGQDLLPLLNMTAEETAALKKEAEDYGMVMSDDAVKASAAFQDSLTKLQGTMTGFKNRMMGEFLPGMTTVTDGISDLIAGNAKGAEKIKNGITDVVKTVNGLVPQALSFLSTIGGALVENAPAVIDTLVEAIFDTDNGFLSENNVGKLVEGAGKIVMAIVSNIPKIISGLLSSLPTIIDAVFDTKDGFLSSENIRSLIDGTVEIVNQIVIHTPEIIAGLIDKIPDIIDNICEAFGPLVGRMLGIGEEAGSALMEGIASFFQPFLGNPLKKITNQIQEQYESIGKSLASEIAAGAKAAVSASKYTFSATGGVFDKPTNVILGEAGPEAVVPLKNNTEWIDKVAQQMSSAMYYADRSMYSAAAYGASAGASPVSVTVTFSGDVHIASDMDVYDVAHKVSGIIADDIVSKGRGFS